MELEHAISDYARARGIQSETRRQWRELQYADQRALLDLALALKLGQNHFRDVLDWCVEISLRDEVSIAAVLGGVAIAGVVQDSHLGRNDKLKHVKASLRALRYPQLIRIEGEVRKRLGNLCTDPRISIAVLSGLEGGLKVELSAHSPDNLEQLALAVASLARDENIREVFDLLTGNENAIVSTP